MSLNNNMDSYAMKRFIDYLLDRQRKRNPQRPDNANALWKPSEEGSDIINILITELQLLNFNTKAHDNYNFMESLNHCHNLTTNQY